MACVSNNQRLLCCFNTILFITLICKSSSKAFERNLVEALSTSGLSTSTFFRLLHESELATKVANEGPFTLLVPTNNAFELLSPEFLSMVRKDIRRLRALLAGHIIKGKILLSDLQDGASELTLLGDEITFSVTSRGVSINGSYISVADIKAANGVIHVLDRVLVLQGENGFGSGSESITDKLNTEDFTILRDLLQYGRLFDILSKGGSFTLFAPSDAAFRHISSSFLSRLKKDQQLLRSVLLQHIVAGKVTFPEQAFSTKIAMSLNGFTLRLSNTRQGYFVNNTRVIKKNIFASNGVVHVLEKPLLPPDKDKIVFPAAEEKPKSENIIDALKNNELNTFKRLIDQVFLTEHFRLGGPFTVFAPSDFAFQKLDKAIKREILADSSLLREVILHHIVRGFVPSSDLLTGWQGQSLNLETLYSTLLGSEISVSGSYIIEADIKLRNGIIHKIDQVILPRSAQTLLPLVRQFDRKGLAIFGKLFQKAGLSYEDLAKDHFTTFIPTDSAFKSLSTSIQKKLQNDASYLHRVLKYHLVPGTVTPTGFQTLKTLPTALGNNFQLSVAGDPMRVNDALAEPLILEFSEGMFYAVDQVLLPPSPFVFINDSITFTRAEDFEGLPELFLMQGLIQEADLVSLFVSEENQTVLMPSNAAIAQADPGVMYQMISDPAFLREVILFHVIPGKFSVEELSKIRFLETMNGKRLNFRINSGIASVNGARVIQRDLKTSSGAMNVIEKLMIPPKFTLAEVLKSFQHLSSAANVWESNGLFSILANASDLTLLVPTNEAFVDAEFERFNYMTTKEAENLLQRHLLYELNGPSYASDLCWRELLFLDGTKASTGVTNSGQIFLKRGARTATIIRENIEATNGVIHVIDSVL